MSLDDELLAIERAPWTGGADAYLEHVDDECMIAFTEISGVLTRREVAGTGEGAPRWRDVEIDVAGPVHPTDGVAVLTHRARARRQDDTRRSLVSSGYVRRAGGWTVAFHHQTPLEG